MTADEAFLIFANAVLQRVLALATSGGVPNVTQAALIFPDGGGSRVITYNTTAYWVLFQTINDGALASMQEAADAVRIHLDQGVLAQPVMSDSNGTIQDPTFEQQVQALVGHLLAPVRDAVERVNTLDVRPEQLLESYWRHRDQLTATQTPSEILVPLLNFRMTGGPVRIIESLEVAAFTGQDKTNVWNSMLSVDEQMPLRQFEQTQFKLFGSFISPRTQPASDNQFLTLVRDVVTAFRLVKPGDVGAPAVFRRITNGLFTRWSSLSFLDDLRVRPMYRAADYAFDSVEASVVTDVIDKLQRIRRSHDIHGLEIGLRRFNQSYTRDQAEDRIIDLTIAIESTLLAGVSNELKFRLLVRGAALLAGIELPAPAKVLLETLYDVRSQIVHEGKTLADQGVAKIIGRARSDIPGFDFTAVCENLVRQVLLVYLNRAASGETVAMVNQHLEQRIFSRLSSLSGGNE